MNRHDLKEQLRHDPFRDSVANVVEYTAAHQRKVIQLTALGVVALLLIGAIIWYASYRRSVREQNLESALAVMSEPVGPPVPGAKSFPTEDAHRQASLKAFTDVVAKAGSTREGMIALYYVGTLKAATDSKSGEADLRKVADSGTDVAALAKIALAQLYAGENRNADAHDLLTSLVNKPTTLVSKQQAQILLAQMELTTNPQDAKKILQSLKGPNANPVVARAADEVASQVSR